MDLYIEKRSVGLSVVLAIITCGIYSLYWLYKLLSAHYRLNSQQSNAGLDIVLIFVTCGIYGIYLMYKLGKMEAETHRVYGAPGKDDSVLYLVLGILNSFCLPGLQIIVLAIVQSNLNNLADRTPGPETAPGSDFGRLQ